MKLLIFHTFLLFGIAHATVPGLSGSNIIQDIIGGLSGSLKFLRGNVNRLSGTGDSEASTFGQEVDGQGSGIQSVGQVSSASDSGYNYNAQQQQTYERPQQTFSAVEPQSSYQYPQQSYERPQQTFSEVAPQSYYQYPQQQQQQVYNQPKPEYGPPRPQQSYSPAAPQQVYNQPKPEYGPPRPQQSYSPAAPQISEKLYVQPQESSDLEDSESGSSNGGGLSSIIKYKKIEQF
jgi:hypothetical protein